jgi:hypothetical protein
VAWRVLCRRSRPRVPSVRAKPCALKVAALTINNGGAGGGAAVAGGRPLVSLVSPVSPVRPNHPSRARLSRDPLAASGRRASPDRRGNRGAATAVRVLALRGPHKDPAHAGNPATLTSVAPPQRGKEVEDLVRRRAEKANSHGGGGGVDVVEAEVPGLAVRVRRVARAVLQDLADASRTAEFAGIEWTSGALA